MAKFRKKPVVIEAFQVPQRGEHPTEEMLDFLDDCDFEGDDDGMIIKTLEGNMLALPGDWIIKGIHGEFYPCKPDIFEKTYERIAG